MRTILNSPYKKLFILSLLVYLTASFFSVGFFHPDEQFQILEFCNYKLGYSAIADMSWEFQQGARPALLPSLGFVIIKTLNTVNIYNPFVYALVLRILTAIISWFVTSSVCLLFINDFSSEKGKKIFVFISLLLWFIPFLSVRFSSENYSAIAFLGAVYFIKKFNSISSNKKIYRLSLAGLLLGFSFFFRFQIGLAIAGLGLWLLLINKMHWKNFLIIVVSGIAAIAFCIYLDYWYYGRFVLTPINYFTANIIENKAADWGVQPWWYYFELIIVKAGPPVSIFLLAFLFIGFYKARTNVLTWCLVPFLLAHFIFGHKEIRFLFPMVFGLTYLAAVGINNFIMTGKYRKAARLLFVISLIVNIPLLLIMTLAPAEESINCYKFLYDYSSNKDMNILCNQRDVYELSGLYANFYRSQSVHTILLNNDAEISNYLETYKPDSIYLVERRFLADNKYAGYSNRIIYGTWPQWIVMFNFNNWMSRAGFWKVLELKRI